jgi:hypothetical protein
MTQKLFRLEFNEKQQNFHLDNGTHKENTYGWVTITEYCTDLEFKILESYVNRTKKNKLSVFYVKKSLKELDQFMSNLMKYNITIDKISKN